MITHEQETKRFVIKLPGGEEAELQYHLQGQMMDMYHTYVPESARGQGLAEKLAAAAFEYAQSQNLKVVPSCPYISRAFLARHPEWKKLAA